MSGASHLYAIGLGSNQRHGRIGHPAAIIRAATAHLAGVGKLKLVRASRIITSRPIGPSQRDYANAALLLKTKLAPPDLLLALQKAERHFGRKRRGQRWGARVLDLDVLLWSGGCWCDDHLLIPHPGLARRDFVLAPLCTIAAQWRDPLSGLRTVHLRARLHKPCAIDPPGRAAKGYMF